MTQAPRVTIGLIVLFLFLLISNFIPVLNLINFLGAFYITTILFFLVPFVLIPILYYKGLIPEKFLWITYSTGGLYILLTVVGITLQSNAIYKLQPESAPVAYEHRDYVLQVSNEDIFDFIGIRAQVDIPFVLTEFDSKMLMPPYARSTEVKPKFTGFAPDDKQVLVMGLEGSDCDLYKDFVYYEGTTFEQVEYCYAYLPYTSIRNILPPTLNYTIDHDYTPLTMSNLWVRKHQADFYVDDHMDQSYILVEANLIPTLPIPTFACIAWSIVSGCGFHMYIQDPDKSLSQEISLDWRRPIFVSPIATTPSLRLDKFAFEQKVLPILNVPQADDDFTSHPKTIELLETIQSNYSQEDLLFALDDNWRETEPAWLSNYQSFTDSFECKTSYRTFSIESVSATYQVYYDADSRILRTEKKMLNTDIQDLFSSNTEFRIVFLNDNVQLYWFPKIINNEPFIRRINEYPIFAGNVDSSDIVYQLEKQYAGRHSRNELECRLWQVDPSLLQRPQKII